MPDNLHNPSRPVSLKPSRASQIERAIGEEWVNLSSGRDAGAALNKIAKLTNERAELLSPAALDDPRR